MQQRSAIPLRLLFFLLIFAIISSSASADSQEYYFKFKTPSVSLIEKLGRVISIDNVTADEIRAYANETELARFQEFGIPYEILPHPGTLLVPRMAANKAEAAEWDNYPTYGAYVAMMNQSQADYPGLCQIVNAGTSVNGRDILFAKISDNVSLQEDEPEVMHTSTMHGDETTGYILCLRLIDSLLSAYGTDSYITRLVDSLEIWINPLANPDGAYYSGDNTIYGARRYNANGADLNRNFPDPAEGDHPDGRSWQPETIAMMNLAANHSFVISANHHGGAEVLNYPWDTWSRSHADEGWYIDICLAWAQLAQEASPSNYMQSFQFPQGITNGYAWYRVTGGRQDFMIYWHGGREITAELSNTKLLPADQLPAHWDYNREGLLGFLESALYGIRGIVTDASTTFPVTATVRVLGHDVDNSQVYTDPDVGDFHRMIAAGTYNVEFSSIGYQPDTVYGVVAVDGLSTRVDVALQPLAGEPDLVLEEHNVKFAQRGESVDMAVMLKNVGNGNATGVSGVLQSSDPYVTITQPNSTFSTIPGLGGTAMSVTDYAFTVSPACPLDYVAQMQLQVSASGGYSSTEALAILVEPIIEDFETANFTAVPWTRGGDADWWLELVDVREGVFSARSGVIGNSQSSKLELEIDVAQPGKIWFDYKVSSEAGYDFLRFYIDDVQQGSWSGNQGWSEVGFDITPGLHSVAWSYTKDEFASDGQDRALLDRIVLPAVISHLEIVTNGAIGWTVDRPLSLQLESIGRMGTAAWSDKYGDLAGSWLTLSSGGQLSGLPTMTGATQFTAQVEDAAGSPVEKPMTVTVNPGPQILTQSLPPAHRDAPFLFQLEVSGGTSPYSWTENTGNLSGTGLTLTSGGLFSGTPTIAATLELNLALVDASGAEDNQPLTLSILSGCCTGIVGDANNDGAYEPTIGDVTTLIDMLFITTQPVVCLAEADVNQSGGSDPTVTDISIGDVTLLIDNLFISGVPLPECL
ncbi:MAG: M14 family zinc carboxypeptidase [Candidatus Zixiibacteriota bacterium]